MIANNLLVRPFSWEKSFARSTFANKIIMHFRFPLTACAISLIVGCGTLAGSHKPTTLSQQTSNDQSILALIQPLPAPAPPIPAAEELKSRLIIPEHPSIDAWVERYSKRYHGSFQKLLDRAPTYMGPAQEAFEEAGLPRELFYIALVESGFSPTACSSANAVGMWQFISSTGKRFGLQQTRWVDERRNPVRAAHAAAEYLSFLYDTFQSWPLALAAYNAGENAVSGALARSGAQTYWQLIEKGYLPAETRNYVPKIFAAITIVRQPDQYGFHFNPEPCDPAFETVAVPGGLSLWWLGKQIGVSDSVLKGYNPALSEPITPPGSSRYDLRVPLGKAELVSRTLSRRSLEGEMVGMTAYKVKHGDTLYRLARKYGCSIDLLASLNGMKRTQILRTGRVINIPLHNSFALAAVQKGKGNAARATTPNVTQKALGSAKARSSRQYSVQSGDTLWSIAKRFRVPVAELCSWNQLNRNQVLYPGDVLTIHNTRPDREV